MDVAASRDRVARVIRAHVPVVTVHGIVLARALDAFVRCAQVLVTAVHRAVDTVAGHALIDSTGVIIVTIDRGMLAVAGRRVTRVLGARIVVFAVICRNALRLALARAGQGLDIEKALVIDCAGVSVVALVAL